MTVDICKQYCRQNNWAIAGVQNSHECYCGNEISTEKISDSKCNKSCRGNSQQTCGGGWAMNIYSLSGELLFSYPKLHTDSESSLSKNYDSPISSQKNAYS